MARDIQFYATFSNPVGKFHRFVERSSEQALAAMDAENRQVAAAAKRIMQDAAPDRAWSTSILPMARSVAQSIHYTTSRSRVGGRETREATVYIDLSNPNVARVYKWILYGTRGHEINATARSRIRKMGIPVLAVGWSGGRSYPSTVLRGTMITHKSRVYVSGWQPNDFVAKGFAIAEPMAYNRLRPKYMSVWVQPLRSVTS